MDISIIIDKSTFQSLNFDELYRLSCYYKHIITPVLTMEILGDLKKETEEGKTLPEERVKDFAKKLFPMETVVNLHYKVLVKGDLLGNYVSMDGRPNVGIKKAVASSSGQKGFLVAETEEEKSIQKWKEGKFSDADKELSAFWRMTTTNEDVLKRIKESIKAKLPEKIKDFEELNIIVNNHLSDPNNQQNFLLALIHNYEIDPMAGFHIFSRWSMAGQPLISEFAKYAFHCLKVDTLFLFGLASNLVSTRPTNRVDLEYLYYQPFGNLFTSNDKVHKNLAPLLVQSYQKFILGTDLKQDLKAIVEYLDIHGIEAKRKFKNKPPIIESSLTFKIWKEIFGYPEKSNLNTEVSEEVLEMMKEKIKEFEQAIETDSININSSEDAEFIVKKSVLNKTDPCFCGSGKKVIDCCIPENEFNKIVAEEMKKDWEKQRK
jgi:hypothetical protein